MNASDQCQGGTGAFCKHVQIAHWNALPGLERCMSLICAAMLRDKAREYGIVASSWYAVEWSARLSVTFIDSCYLAFPIPDRSLHLFCL